MSTDTTIWQQIEETTLQNEQNVDQVLNLSEFNLMAVTGHSTRLEGSTLTLQETITLLEENITAKGKPLVHHQMAIDHHEALLFVLNQAKEKKLMTLELLQVIAAKVMKQTGKTVKSVLGETNESNGDLRKVNVSAGGRFFVNYDKVLPMVTLLLSKLNENLPKVKSIEQIHTLAFVSHFDLVSIHPFTDGNGRVSRLLMNYVQAYHEQPITIVKSESKIDYIQALEQSRHQASTQPIVSFLASQHLEWLMELQAKFKQANQKDTRKSQGEAGFSIFF